MSERTWCYEDACPDKEKYGTLIYTITCDACIKKKRILMKQCPTCGYPLCSDCSLCSWHCPAGHCECPDNWMDYEEDDED